MSNDMGYNQHYINRIHETLQSSLREYPRTFILNIILRFPDANYESYKADHTVITRFIESLKSQIKFTQKRKEKQGKRVHPCNLRYVWAREFGEEKGKKHYHVALMLNNDAWYSAGTYYPVQGHYVHCLGLMIMEAWVRTLNLHVQQDYEKKYYPLIEFVLEGDFNLNTKGEHFAWHYDTIMRRLSYLAKRFSKDNSDGQRNFGCSQS
ncbi:inovirus Gp2 family protein [Raoultella ornithinolytica]|uniref:inovirus Gp2 family protein n=1 Tax=Raoultella ornithinolytica TaxID=54291 RepID=UPI001A1BE8EA|nr:inovirus Gp2 family protein [Raoultella ornithinolytica]MCZ0877317.1 inovirus Gp2 family protein [Raoultella ornithinolytica]HAT3642686.1 inovirus Gp2 family protein [Raoultella ornithinolytica]HAT3647306.1 inovirus Gp2 family protein [Raoultella ornithinolytica]